MDVLTELHGERKIFRMHAWAIGRAATIAYLKRSNLDVGQAEKLWEELARHSSLRGRARRAYMVLANDTGVLAVYDVTRARYKGDDIVGIVEVEDTDTIAAVLANK